MTTIKQQLGNSINIDLSNNNIKIKNPNLPITRQAPPIPEKHFQTGISPYKSQLHQPKITNFSTSSTIY